MQYYKTLTLVLLFIFISITSYIVYRILDQPIKLMKETKINVEIFDVSFGQRADCKYAYLNGFIRTFGRHGECRVNLIIPPINQFIEYTMNQLDRNVSDENINQLTYHTIDQYFDMILKQDKRFSKDNLKSEFLQLNFATKLNKQIK